MNRETMIRKAVELLAPKDRRRCAEQIEKAMTRVDDLFEQEAARLWGSQHTKRELNRLVAAFKRAKISISKLPQPFRSEFEKIRFFRPDDDIVDDGATVEITTYGVDDLIADAEVMLGFPTAPKYRSSHRQRVAVREAFVLLKKYGHKPTRTRRGKWDKLAALLVSEPQSSLYRHLLRYRTK